MAAQHYFKRIILGLPPRAPDHTIRLAAELAELLRLELLGVFFDDAGLRDLAAMPFAREFRPLSGGWRAINPEQISQDLDLAERASRRLFGEAVKQVSMTCRFEVIQGPAAAAIASISSHDDILMVRMPVSPAERATYDVTRLIDAAFRSAAAIMLVPTQIARRRGPIVAVAISQDDPSIRAAEAIADAVGENLIVIDAVGTSASPHGAGNTNRADMRVQHVSARKTQLSHASGIESAFRQMDERLIVMTRGAFDDRIPSIIAAARHIPVLVITPADI